ncbi:helix-turn-helix domain-containing protein [Paenibacillus sp. NFR01]|uniref:helix-turn-helix domain-containing protein n=1 Tax=Paenibacillus sp. NFR01 TaxID=1566279 RepID=UPI0008AF67AB|nr:helix-turn-helix transcriptional regulator [Paenibacillus sp. NFR01]SET95638.1 Transcriptional regulator, contains XRE-family HTH domain [Paenibacillus sp. NFR01]
MQTIYERIEFLIKQKGLTKKAFCQQMNISTGNFGDWKRGKSTPGTHNLIEIAGFFKVSLDWLILGKTAAEVIRESEGEYFIAQKRQLDCQMDELLPEEQAFIKEYLAFAEYRKNKQDGAE